MCQNDVLKEVKAEPTDWRPDVRELSTCSENFDQQQPCNKINDEDNEQIIKVMSYVCVVCRKSFKQSEQHYNSRIIIY